ncbi:MAG: hypothetical protein AAFR47_21700 [Pseudomonadota bacterium]
MHGFSDFFGGMLRPLLLAAALLVGLGLLSDQPGSGVRGSEGFTCRGWTNDADLNRLLCQIHPARLWNTPIANFLPVSEDQVSADTPAVADPEGDG